MNEQSGPHWKEQNLYDVVSELYNHIFKKENFKNQLCFKQIIKKKYGILEYFFL